MRSSSAHMAPARPRAGAFRSIRPKTHTPWRAAPRPRPPKRMSIQMLVTSVPASQGYKADDPTLERVLAGFKTTKKRMSQGVKEDLNEHMALLTMDCLQTMDCLHTMEEMDTCNDTVDTSEAISIVLGVLGDAAARGCIDVQPPPEEIQRLVKLALKRLQGPELSKLTASQMADVLTCVVHIAPNNVGIPWVTDLASALFPVMGELEPKALAYTLMLFSLLTITAHWKPEREWMAKAQELLWLHLDTLSPTHLAYGLYGIAHLNAKPEEHILDQVRSAVENHKADFDPADLALILVSCSHMGVDFHPGGPDPPPPEMTTEARIPKHIYARPDNFAPFFRGLTDKGIAAQCP